MSRIRLLIPFGLCAVVAALALTLSPFAQTADAFSTGQFQHNGGPQVGGATCANCHSGGDSAASVSLNVPTNLGVGETTTITVVVSGGPGVVAGFNAATAGLVGEVRSIDGATQSLSGEATHTTPRAMTNGQASFSFEWTAPADATTVEWYVAALSANGDAVTTGDSVATTSGSITIEAAPTPTPTAVRAPIDDPVTTATATPEPEPEPVGVSADGGAGAYGFGLNPQPGDAATTLAVTGSAALTSASIAAALFGAGGCFVVAARRRNQGTR